MRSCAAVMLFFGIWLSVAALPAQPAFFPVWDADSVSVQVRNDAFGPGPVSEWDDLRTFGIELTTPILGPLAAEANYDSLTWRAENAVNAARIDVARLLVGWRLPSMALRPFFLDTTLEAGVEVVGDLGGLLLQEGHHSNVAISRPFPEVYDAFSTITPAAAVSVQLGWEGDIWHVALMTAVEGELGVGARAGAGIRLSVGSDRSGFAATLRALADPMRGVSSTLDQVSAHDSGVIWGFDCAAGRVRTSAELNLSTGVSNGGYGLQFDLGGRSGAAFSGAVEVSCPVTSVSPAQRVLIPAGASWFRFYASQGGGWWNLPESAASAFRFSDYGTGVEGRFMAILGSIEAEAALAAGPFLSVVTEQTQGEPRSSVVGAGWVAGLRLEPALRIGILEADGDGPVLKSGVGVSCPLNLGVFGGYPMAGHEIAVKVLFFGETR
jgi:hypothetical protein